VIHHMRTSPSEILLAARFERHQERTYQHVPFEVPEGIDQLHISIAYNNRIGSSPMLTGGNTLDIGLFDEQGTASGGPGLRGWSGSERTEITIDRDWATPPYRAGAIGAGTWNVLLGAYKVDASGLDVTVTVTLGSVHPRPDQPAWPDLATLRRMPVPPAAEPGWYRGDLHMHTVYSDGDSYPHEVAAAIYTNGLDFYGITDHNRAQSPIGLVPQGDGWPVLVPGVEVTTYAGHFNVWGTEGWYDFRDPTAEGLQAAVDAARAEGGLVSLNHPKPYGPAWDFPEVNGFDAIETWNGWWGRLNNVSTSFWAERLNASNPLAWPVGVGGSDAHKIGHADLNATPLSAARIGCPTLWIQTDEFLSAASVIDAIRAGRCFVSESPFGPQIYARREGDEIVVRIVGAEGDALLDVGPHGCLAAGAIREHDATLRWSIADLVNDHDVPFIRFEIHTPTGGIRALSNPVWLV
jgi:predicted metal-dependent phosphoesterase TrpH